MDKLEDYESFLSKVDKISELVKELKSSDAEAQQRAVERADCYIAALDDSCVTKVNKTTINTSRPSASLQNDSPESLADGGLFGVFNFGLQDATIEILMRSDKGLRQRGLAENFMKILEKDAEDRKVRRAAKVKKATALKEKGNEAYAQEDYETAVKYYSDGLVELRDMQPLYTNRAQAFIKLGKYKEAISDCEWALKCDEKCIKAYLHMGKAYLALRKYNESRNCFEKIVEIGKKNMMTEYLTQVDLEEERDRQEMNAAWEFEKGDAKATTAPKLLEMLSRPGQTALYYRGGLEILSRAVTDCTSQTLFRLNNGFSIISGNDMVRSCLLQKTTDQGSQQLCASVLKLWSAVCSGNDENKKTLLSCPVSQQSVVHLVTSENVAVREECLALLYVFSQTPHSRRLAIDNLNVHMLVRNLMACITKPQQQQENTAVNILDNFRAENRFCIQLRDASTDSVIVPFTSILRNVGKSNQLVLPSLISTVGGLARDDVIRNNFAHDQDCWKAFLIAIKQCIACEYRLILYPLLGLIINLSAVTSPVIQELAVPLSDCCLGLLRDGDGGVITRATGVLSTVLPQSSEAVQHAVRGNVVRTMRRMLKGTGQSATKYAIKTLTVCTAASHLAREELLKYDEKLSVLRHLLGSSCDEMVSGNAALCLAHCLELKGTASNLLGTDIVPLLLRHAAGDAKRTAVQQNAAIALGKLCRSEPRHMNKLRQLHGLEILHSCVKLIASHS